jgi:hypothetical protein
MAFEGAGVPYFTEKETEAFYYLDASFEIFEEEKVSEGRDMGKYLDDYVHVVVCFEIVDSNET